MTARHEHLDEGTIHAWLDGALPPDESARIEALVGTCGECAALVAEARGLVAASSRILSSLDMMPGGVIPGTDAGADQLAALRARRRETSRRWWNDRRILAAASLVFVAGASSLVWRFASTDAASGVERAADAVRSEAESAIPMAAAPGAAPAPASAREAASPDARVAGSAPLRDAAPVRVAAKREIDSTADQKVAAPASSLTRAAAANEARRLDSSSVAPKTQVFDSTRATQRLAERSAFEIQLQQGATQQANRQRAEQLRPTAPPPALAPGARLGAVVTTGVGAAAADAVLSPIGCYELRLILDDSGRTAADPDTIRLLDDQAQERDAGWRRAQRVGDARPPIAMTWREVDSLIVELKTRSASDSSTVRFFWRVPMLRQGGGQVPVRGIPDQTELRGARGATAIRLRCP